MSAVGQDDARDVVGGRCQGFADLFADGTGAGDGQHGHHREAHHRVPVSVSGTTTTALDDLALRCSNCHTMIHKE